MRLRYQKRALRQIDRALSYIYGHSPQGAAHVEARLRAITALLLDRSFVGRKTSAPGVRRIFLTPYPYSIDYVIDGEDIVVQRFRHTSRKPLRE